MERMNCSPCSRTYFSPIHQWTFKDIKKIKILTLEQIFLKKDTRITTKNNVYRQERHFPRLMPWGRRGYLISKSLQVPILQDTKHSCSQAMNSIISRKFVAVKHQKGSPSVPVPEHWMFICGHTRLPAFRRCQALDSSEGDTWVKGTRTFRQVNFMLQSSASNTSDQKHHLMQRM